MDKTCNGAYLSNEDGATNPGNHLKLCLCHPKYGGPFFKMVSFGAKIHQLKTRETYHAQLVCNKQLIRHRWDPLDDQPLAATKLDRKVNSDHPHAQADDRRRFCVATCFFRFLNAPTNCPGVKVSGVPWRCLGF